MSDDSDVRLCPLTGWTTATLPEGHGLLELEYVNDPAQLVSGRRYRIRLAMTAAQADELAQVLQRMAAKSRERQAAEKRLE